MWGWGRGWSQDGQWSWGVAPEETGALGLAGGVPAGCECHAEVTEKPARGFGAFGCWSLGLLLGSRRMNLLQKWHGITELRLPGGPGSVFSRAYIEL